MQIDFLQFASLKNVACLTFQNASGRFCILALIICGVRSERGAIRLAHSFGGYLRVNARRCRRRMTQHILHDCQIAGGIQQFGRERVPQRVGRHRYFDSRRVRQFAKY